MEAAGARGQAGTAEAQSGGSLNAVGLGPMARGGEDWAPPLWGWQWGQGLGWDRMEWDLPFGMVELPWPPHHHHEL